MATSSSIVDDDDDPSSDHHQGLPILGDHGPGVWCAWVERFQLDHEQLPPLMAAVLRQLQKARVEMEPTGGAP